MQTIPTTDVTACDAHPLMMTQMTASSTAGRASRHRAPKKNVQLVMERPQRK
jgi:hypothetical protein